jgi:hypothetical protein
VLERVGATLALEKRSEDSDDQGRFKAFAKSDDEGG